MSENTPPPAQPRPGPTAVLLDRLADEAVTVAAIVGVTGLGLAGVTDPFVLSAVAGLGGYHLKQRALTNTAKNQNQKQEQQ